MSRAQGLFRALISLVPAAAALLLLGAGPAFAGQPSLAVLPLQLHAEQEHEHLREAVPGMLSSRLARTEGYDSVDRSRIEELQIEPAELDRELALQAGQELDADFVLKCTLSVVGQSWNLDSLLYRVSDGEVLASFTRTGEHTRELIPELDIVVEQVRSALREAEERAELREAPLQADLTGAWTGPGIERNLTGLASADVTGDGRTEIVLVDRDSVLLYRIENNSLERLDKVSAPRHTNPVAVDAGDTRGMGAAAVFVTAKNNRGNMLRSFALRYEDGEFERVLEDSPWFLRIAPDGQGGRTLLGQRHSLEGDPFQPEVMRLELDGGQLEPQGKLMDHLSRVNVLGLALDYKQGDKEPAAAALDSRDRLRILDPQGRDRWTSEKKLGGSNLYMQGPEISQGTGHDRFYLPGRSSLLALHGGEAQIFTFRNEGWLGVQTKRLRTFDSGRLVGLQWDGDQLSEEWRSSSYDGLLRDVTLADLNGDGQKELAALWIKDHGGWFSQPESRVVVVPMQE